VETFMSFYMVTCQLTKYINQDIVNIWIYRNGKQSKLVIGEEKNEI
jgi:hypothetical protein